MRRIAIAALAAVFAIPVAADDTVVLRGPEGLEVTGALLDHDGRFYRIGASEGVLTLDGAAFECEGAACPDAPNRLQEVVILADPVASDVLLPALIEAHAARTGREVERFPEAAGAVWVLGGADEAEVLIHVRPVPAAEALAALAAEAADIAVTTRPATPRERRSAEAAGAGDPDAAGRGRVLALMGLVPVAAPGTDLEAPTLPQLAALFAGGGGGRSGPGDAAVPVRPHLPLPDTGVDPAFRERAMAAAGREVAADVARHADEAALLGAVAATPGGIGVAVADGDVGPARALALRPACGPPVRPSAAAVRSGDWPLVAPVMVYLPPRPAPPEARALLRFILSIEAQLVIRRAGFVDQAAAGVPIAQQGERFASAILAARDAEDLAELRRMTRRLRPLARQGETFRFEAEGAGLDATSREAISRLAEALATGRRQGPVLLAGFWSGEASAVSNRRLALHQARRVAAALRAALPEGTEVEIEVDGFEEVPPPGCDDGPWGRQAGRRVEIWLPRNP